VYGAPFHEGLGRLPDAFELRLGDFGNSVHVSEVAQYYADFDMQTLPYRAPEVRHTTHLPSSLVPLVSMPRHLTSRLVPPHLDTQVLLGVPFGCQIDVWSLGVLLVEVCVGKVGFSVPHVGRVCRSVTHAPSPRTLLLPPRRTLPSVLSCARTQI
jgi:serine/threonine protein kinase